MPHPATYKLHRRRRKRVVLGEIQLRSKDAAFKRRALRTLDERFPVEHIVFRHGSRGDAIGRVRRQILVFMEQTLLCHRGRHGQATV